MPRHYITIILTFLTLTAVNGQTEKTSCDCPKTEFAGTKAEETFHLSNGKTIVLCGYKNKDSKPTSYSEFILAVCGQDTIIDFWGAVLTCQLKVEKDTLLVDRLQNLPTGKNFKFQETTWTTEKLYFKGQTLVRELLVNRQIRKYTQDEIQIVINEYEAASEGLGDKKMDFANRLFIATISGDKKARNYFMEFPSKCDVLDGANKEEYDDLLAMLLQWDTNK